VTFFSDCAQLRGRSFNNNNNNTTQTMKKTIKNFRTLLAATIAITAIAVSAQGANLSDKDKQFLVGYEKVHTALAADDLSTAKSVAKDLGEEVGDIAKAGSLKDARAGFEKLSSRAKTLVAGHSDYHVFPCPMLNKDWVQTSTTVANPYGGKEMIGCGEIQK
jgi:hypothetical protein